MLSSLMNPLSTRLKLYRLAIGACGFDAADSGGVGFSPSFDVCAHEYPQEEMRVTASASVETRMAPSSEQRWDVRSLTPTQVWLNLNTCDCASVILHCTGKLVFATEISAFLASYQTLMPQVRFLDSMKPDKYGPRGF